METVQLSPRLNAVLQFIPKSKCLADIGSDHAHLPLRAVQDKIAGTAIAGEVRPGPYYQALNNVKTSRMQEYIDVRMGDGLDVIREPGQADAIVIAGMGGELIRDILERGKSKLSTNTVLILQPNIREAYVRKWLNDNGWDIIDERIVEEFPHFYEIIQARQVAERKELTDMELQMGPILSKKGEPAFIKKWKRREKKLFDILDALNHAEETDSVRRKKEDSENYLQLIKSCLNQLES